MIGIIGAMDIEIDKLRAIMNDVYITRYHDRDFYRGTINDKEVVLVKAGIGKVNAAITTTLLLENYDVDYVVNTGVAGGVSVDPNTLVIADKFIYHDVDLTNFDYELGQLPGEERFFHVAEYLLDDATKAAKSLGYDYNVGLIATGDVFVTKLDEIKPLVDDLNILAIEMEGAAIAQVANQYHKAFIAIRAISDRVGMENQTTDYREFSIQAADQAAMLIDCLIKG